MSSPVTEQSPVIINLRIPGQWTGPQDFSSQLPAGYRMSKEGMHMPDGTVIEFGAMKPDTEFARIFRSSCRNKATPAELAVVDNYKVNFILSGPGGSLPAALTMMRAAAAVIQAGGAGVFIDNSGVAHGAEQWLAMSDDGSADALSFAYVAIVASKVDVYTTGMHILGLREIVMKRADADAGHLDPVDVIRYVCNSDKPIDDGHILADLKAFRYRVAFRDSPTELAGSVMQNSFGQMHLLSMRDEAERN